jgi:hypothetical protein
MGDDARVHHYGGGRYLNFLIIVRLGFKVSFERTSWGSGL